MLSIQAVTAATNHNQFNNGHAWMDNIIVEPLHTG